MKWLLVLCLSLMGLLKGFAQEARLDTIRYSGPVDNRLNIVILGDGYLETRSELFRQHALQASIGLFDELPFKNYQNYFNVFSIFVPSNAHGAASTPKKLIDNQYGSTFFYAGIERLLVPTKPERVVEVLTENFPKFDQVLMLVNTGRYGGSGGWIATSSVHEEAGEIIRHEIGHSFGDLADEYWAGAQYATETYNMTKESSEALVRWKSWVGDFTVGVYPYPANKDWYKPHKNCKMEVLGARFCSVCTEQLIRKIQSSVLAIDQFSPIEQEAGDEPIRFEIKPVVPIPNTLKTRWTFDGDLLADNTYFVEIDPRNLSNDFHELHVSLIDTTKYDRRDKVQVNSITWTIGESVTSVFDRDLETREQDRLLTVKATDQNTLSFELYPNPTTDFVTILHEYKQPEQVQMELVNQHGQVLRRLEYTLKSSKSMLYDIDMRAYGAGIYFLRVRSQAFVHSFKVIKK